MIQAKTNSICLGSYGGGNSGSYGGNSGSSGGNSGSSGNSGNGANGKISITRLTV